MLQRLKRSNYARSVAILSSGTALAQAIPIAVSPILTRLYSPEEFGLVAVYMACVSVVSVIATGRYEMAITLPASDTDAANIVSLALKLCACISLLLYLPIALFGQIIANALNYASLAPWLYLIPLSVMATGVFNVFQFWCNRTSQYRKMSVNRIQNNGFIVLANLAFGWGKIAGGMILGGVVGQSLSAAIISRTIWRRSHATLSKRCREDEIDLAKRYISHPKHIAPSHLIGAASQQIPVFLMSTFYSLAGAGFFSLAYRVVSLPLSLIANAIGDVFRQKIAAAYNERGEFKDIFKKTIISTALIAILPFSVLYIVTPSLFAFVFGESWRVAGEYAQIIVVSSFFQFTINPIDKVFLVYQKTIYEFYIQIIRAMFLVGLFLVVAFYAIDIKYTVILFTVLMSLLYLIVLAFAVRLVYLN